MDELEQFCRRVLGDVAAASDAATEARQSAEGRVDRLAAAARLCREVTEDPPAVDAERADGLAAAVAAELAAANARLPERQREALALRDLLRLPYEQIARVLEMERAAVPSLLARARLRLRAERRGTDASPAEECQDRERALRLMASRLDSEPLTGEDDEWLLAHLRGCSGCAAAHAAMLEASVCYRVWPAEPSGTATA